MEDMFVVKELFSGASKCFHMRLMPFLHGSNAGDTINIISFPLVH